MTVEDISEEDIFRNAIEFEDRDKQVDYVKKACGDDTELCAAVEALLRHHYQSSILDAPALESNLLQDTTPITEGPGTTIGRYKLLEKIGEGGMAVVYMAEQSEPIRRKVALKIIKLGMDTKSVIARFEAERQALAMMDHPNIAKVLDAGATETGRPYFVMELVTGVSITEYCDKNNLSTKERLALFIQVCNAVQHAHQKGIIHRDIKPTNVMVTRHEGRPMPKVIDFGIAKATNQKLTEKTLFTRYAHIIGTPAYMSPEQADLGDTDVDTRSDIYSLGVLLYELLTGATPFSEEELRKAGYLEMQRLIREQEPPKPSTKLSTLGETLTDIAKYRGCTPDLLAKAIRGDLDWIVMKSLEKDRFRRYETANGLAMDIQRHLEHEPVLARGPSTMYRSHKFLQRHRSQTIAVLAIAIIASTVAVILLMWNRDRLQLTEAEGIRHRNILSQAREQYAKAEREAALEIIKPILNSRHVGPEAKLLHAGILIDNRRSEVAVTILSNLLNERPEIAGTAHSLLARILWESESPNAEKIKEIEEHRRKAEALLPDTAEAYFLRAMTAVTIREQLASLDRALQLDSGHYESRRLRAFTYFASRKYDRLRDDALAMTILRPRDPMGYSLRAIALRELKKYTEAIVEYDRAIALTAEGSTQYIDLSTQRCETLLRMGDYKRVISDAEACLKLSPEKPVFQYQIFCAQTALGDYDKATTLFRQIISPGHEARREFQEWCMKYVFDTLDAGRSWYPPDNEPLATPFLPMLEAEEIYRNLSAKAHRVTTDGFSADWSPNGKKLALSLGVHGYSGVAIFDPATKETDLLIVPGKNPRWSPDGKHIAFVRDCQFLRVSEFIAAERKYQHRALQDEEVWVMNADGTEPRRLARGGWLSWSQDSTQVYYHSRVSKALCSISMVGSDSEPKQIMRCSNFYPSVSPDDRRVAYLEGPFLKIKDLGSQAVVVEQPVPIPTWGGAGWSPTAREVCLAGHAANDNRTGLWIYGLDKNEPRRILDGQITVGSWSPDGTKLAFCLGPAYYEIWAAHLDPNVPTVEALGPSQTSDEQLREMIAFYTQRIEANPEDTDNYFRRAEYHGYRGDRASASADMRRWSAVAGGGQPSDLPFATRPDFRRVLSLPFDCELVFSAERPVNTISIMSFAFGQKGRCKMKLFKIPMFVTSLFGLCLVSGIDAPPAYADFTFGEPVNLGPKVNTSANAAAPCISADGLSLFFTSDRVGGYGGWDIWVLTRETTGDPWGEAVNLGPLINGSLHESGPSLSADGLSLYFSALFPPGGYGSADILVTRRATRNSSWGTPVNLGPTVNSPAADYGPAISFDGLQLFFSDYPGALRPGGYGDRDIWFSTRATTNDPWSEPVNLGSTVNSSACDTHPAISADGLMLFFTSERSGGQGRDIWIARRTTADDDWGTPVNLGPMVNSPSTESDPSISPDGRTLYFYSDRPGGYGGADLWQASVIPIVDFNGDGIVDSADMCIMVDHWGMDKSLCDIGPTPFGDGIVDVQDLIVLAEHLFEDVSDPTLIAHWALDETEGSMANDCISGEDSFVLGEPVWQPAGGMIGGALQLDGIDDCIIGSTGLNPAEGPFSIVAWIKGGAPGQVIISQPAGSDWLAVDAEGKLMTEIVGSDQSATTLLSEVIITDEQWHRIGLVWNGSRRMLCVDGVIATEDTQDGLGDSGNGLYIGVGKNYAAGTYFSGLIDDIRIYNRVVHP